MLIPYKLLGFTITPATKCPKAVIPAKTGIQKDTGGRIKCRMTK